MSFLVFLFCSLVFSDEVKFKTGKINLGKVPLQIEIADTDETRAYGLMYRKSMDLKHGMIFVFPDERKRSFWMKNTFVPLSIGFFDSRRKLVEILDMEPVKSEMDENPPSYPSTQAAKYALEVKKGWFSKNAIKVGTTFDWIK